VWVSTAAAALDRADVLADLRTRYDIPPGIIHLDGTSARTSPPTDRGTAESAPSQDWRPQAWWAAHSIAGLVGADAEELTVAESTSMNLFQALLGAAQLRPDRRVLLLGRDCFANDHYLARSAADFVGCQLRLLGDVEDLPSALDKQVALVALSHTDLISGGVRDAAALTAGIHRRGALALWSLSYSTGALPVDLHGWNADFAIGCGSTYLGGGSGAPAYSFVARRHHPELRDLVAERGARSQDGVLNPMSTGLVAPSTQSLARLRTGLSIVEEAGSAQLEAKTSGLLRLFLDRVDEQCGDGIEVVAPPESAARGSQVSLRHPHALRLSKGLFARGIITDFVEPDLLRFSFAPTWLRYVDVWEAADQLRQVLSEGAHWSEATTSA
jgi:kynureninase